MTSHKAAAIILNGGQARRMSGADKAQIEIDGQSILNRQLEVLKQRFPDVAMVGKSQASGQPPPIPILQDRLGGKGPLDGIAAGLAWSPQPWLFVVASDMPFLSLALIDALLAHRNADSDIVCVGLEKRAQPLFTLYHLRVLPILDEFLGQGRLRASALLITPPEGLSLTYLPEAQARLCDPELRSFRNLNSPQDVLTSGGRIE